MRFLSRNIRQSAIVFMVLLTILLLLASFTSPLKSQAPSSPTDLSYQAFAQLAAIYQAGGQSPELVSKLNQALDLIQAAQNARNQGNNVDADKLDNQAVSIIRSAQSEIPAAQAEAARTSNSRTTITLTVIPVTVALCTLAFYAGLRVWRYYAKLKLYEMRIVEKSNEA